jgi:hypothetical protein
MALLVIVFSQLGISQHRPLTVLVTKDVQLKSQTYSEIESTSSPDSKKSVLLAVVASLLVPGMGELYAGSFESGKYHLMAEGGLWLTYAGFRKYSDWIGQDARTFANQHAGANFDKKDDQYDVNIGNFNTTEEYNQAKSRNREYDLMYSGNSFSWDWNGVDANRLRFKELRIRSSEVKNNAKFVIAAVVVNHLLSAFSAGRRASMYNKSLSSLDEVSIQTYTMNTGFGIDGVSLSISTSF